MNSNRRRAKKRQHAPFVRALAFALLSFIAFSSIVEAVHKHGNLLLPSQTISTAEAFSNQQDSNSSSTLPSSGGDCLICQLQQHLFYSLFDAAPHLAPPASQPAALQADASLYLSLFDVSNHGRAPPQISLL